MHACLLTDEWWWRNEECDDNYTLLLALTDPRQLLLFASRPKPNPNQQNQSGSFISPTCSKYHPRQSFIFTTVLANRTATFASVSLNPFSLLATVTFPSFSSSFILFPLSLYLCNSIHTWILSLKITIVVVFSYTVIVFVTLQQDVPYLSSSSHRL